MAHSWEAECEYIYQHDLWGDVPFEYHNAKHELHDIVQMIADANEDTYDNTMAAVEKVFGGSLDACDDYERYLEEIRRWYPHVLEVIEETKRKRDTKCCHECL